MYWIEELLRNKVEIHHSWYIARPHRSDVIPRRIKDAWYVLMGHADAVYFTEDLYDKKNAMYMREGI